MNERTRVCFGLTVPDLHFDTQAQRPEHFSCLTCSPPLSPVRCAHHTWPLQYSLRSCRGRRTNLQTPRPESRHPATTLCTAIMSRHHEINNSPNEDIPHASACTYSRSSPWHFAQTGPRADIGERVPLHGTRTVYSRH